MGWGFRVSPQKNMTVRLATGQEIERSVPSGKYPSLSVEILEQTERDEPGGRFGLEYSFPGSRDNKLSLSLHSRSTTSDSWRCQNMDAAFQFFFSGADRRYYYLSHGGELGYERLFENLFKFRTAVYFERVRSLDDKSLWTMFGDDKYIEDNPAVLHGDDYGFSFGIGVERMNEAGMGFFPEGWKMNIACDRGGGNNFKYSMITANAGFAFRAGEKNYLNGAVRLGTAFNPLPMHRHFSLGEEIVGVDTFERDFGVFDRRGDRLVLFKAGGSRFFHFPMELVNKFSYDWSLDIIASAGRTWYSKDPDDAATLLKHGFSGMGAGAGIGLSCSISNMRFGAIYSSNFNKDYDGPNFIFSVSR